ncbi:MAG: hypothetical protein R3320_01000, partial [Nitriliruptorales bacterium]|nr:hypothetical protein [Nitriliruptorales bacterium]
MGVGFEVSDTTTVRCPECGEPAARFCGNCGALVRPKTASGDPVSLDADPELDEEDVDVPDEL